MSEPGAIRGGSKFRSLPDRLGIVRARTELRWGERGGSLAAPLRVDELQLRAHYAHAVTLAQVRLVALLDDALAAGVHRDRHVPAQLLIAPGSLRIDRATRCTDHHELRLALAEGEHRAAVGRLARCHGLGWGHDAERDPLLLLRRPLHRDDDAAVV